MTVLTLDAALDGCAAGLVRDGITIAEQRAPGGRGSTAALPLLARTVLQVADLSASALSGIAVTVGPGSFTGVRAALALAHGIALGSGVPVWGVTVGAALRAECVGSRPIWVGIDSKRGRIFLDRGGAIETVALDAIPSPDGPIAVAGDAAIALASRLAARGFDIQLLGNRIPAAAGVAAADRLPALPLYVDPPEARPGPPGRPAPV